MSQSIHAPDCPHLWAFDVSQGDTKASRSHRVIITGCFEGSIPTFQEQTKASRPGVREDVDTCFLYLFLFWRVIRIDLWSLGGREKSQSVEVLYTCCCEETCYRIAYIQNEPLWACMAYIFIQCPPHKLEILSAHDPCLILGAACRSNEYEVTPWSSRSSTRACFFSPMSALEAERMGSSRIPQSLLLKVVFDLLAFIAI